MNCLNTLTDWELRKAGGDDSLLNEDWKKNLPEWFKLEAGFMFLLEDDPAIVVGVGRHSYIDHYTEDTKFGTLTGSRYEYHPVDWVVASRYKGHWVFSAVSSFDVLGYQNTFKPLPQ